MSKIEALKMTILQYSNLIDSLLFNLKLKIMLRWTITFIVIAIIAAVLGFGGIAGAAAGIAKIIFFIFIVLFVLSLLKGVVKK